MFTCSGQTAKSEMPTPEFRHFKVLRECFFANCFLRAFFFQKITNNSIAISFVPSKAFDMILNK